MGFIQIQFRKGTASEWTAANPVLARAEIGVETDTGLFKIGNGSNNWNSLAYSSTYWNSLVGTPSGLISSSTQVNYTQLQNIPTGIVSASTQVNYAQLQNIPIGLISSSTQVNYGQLQNIPTGIVSSSSQIDVRNAIGTSTLATTGSNIFVGNQTISGSVTILNNLTVIGSSSISYISQSTLDIGTNLITVNAQTPSVRFGGLAVIDSGSSPRASGSFLFDAIKNNFIFVHEGSTVTSSIFLLGPETYNDLGNEILPTPNKLIKSINSEHLGDSNISDTGTLVTIGSNTDVSGALNISGSAKIDGNVVIQNGVFTKYILQNDNSVTGSLSTTNAAIWIGSETSHEVAIILAGSPAFKVNTISNFIPTTDALQDIGSSSERIRTLWVANISSSTAIPSASYAETSSYVASASYALSSSNAVTASYVLSALSSSNAVTASYAIQVQNNIRIVSSSDSFLLTDNYIIVSSGFVTMSLPLAENNIGEQFSIKNIGTGQVMLLPSGSNTIDGYPTFTVEETNSMLGLTSIGITGWIVT